MQAPTTFGMLVPSSNLVDSLVPMGRLGSLALRERCRSGATLAEISRATGGRWLPDQLMNVERGIVALSDDDIEVLAAAYQMDLGPRFEPWAGSPTLDGARSGLRVSLDRSYALDVNPVPFEATAAGEPDYELVAERFLALAVMVGLDVTSEAFGFDVFADAIDHSRSEAAVLLEQTLEQRRGEIASLADSFVGRRSIARLGLLIAETRHGTLLLS